MNNSGTDFLVEFVFESDAIEGIRDDKDVLRSEIEVGKDDGHVGALLLLDEMARKRRWVLDRETICYVQGLITAEQHMKPGGPMLPVRYVGQYRDVRIFIGEREGIVPKEVPLAMESLVKRARIWQGWQGRNLAGLWQLVLMRTADFHFDFERIHPFADGNGRSGRALVYYLLRYFGLRPFIFTNADKHETYYQCFGERKAMHEYFCKRYRPE